MFKSKTYLDSIDISPNEFFAKVTETKEIPETRMSTTIADSTQGWVRMIGMSRSS